MNHSWKVGFSFGITSSILTTLGLMVGLSAGTHSKMIVLGGIITLAVADSLSDALGIHVSEESENKHSQKEIWEATIATFLTKLVFTLSFIVPILIFDLSLAIIISAFWGILLLSLFSYSLAKKQKIKPWKIITEHLGIAIIIIAATHYVGVLVSSFIG